MALRDTQLKPQADTDLDNNDRNRVRQQTAEPYGDQPLHAESRVTFERHFAGQPLETEADHEANEELRAEQYARACEDPAFALQMKIKVDDEDKGEAWEHVGQPLLIGDPDDLEVADDSGRPDHDGGDDVPHGNDTDGDGDADDDDLSLAEINQVEQEYEHQLDDENDSKGVK